MYCYCECIVRSDWVSMGAQVGARLASAVWFPALVRTASGTHADVLEGSLIRHLFWGLPWLVASEVCVCWGGLVRARGETCVCCSVLLHRYAPRLTLAERLVMLCLTLSLRGEAGQVPPQQSVLPRSYVAGRSSFFPVGAQGDVYLLNLR